MPVQWAVIGPVVMRIAGALIGDPLVYRWLDNATKGTKTWVDDLVWKAIKVALDIPEPDQQIDVARANLGQVQQVYDTVKTEVDSGATISGDRIAEITRSIMPWAPLGID